MEYRRAVLSEGRELLSASLDDIEIRDSGAGPDHFTLIGHAAMFNTLSEDLGGFREIIKPGAFTDALRGSLVHMLWNHDSSKPLASTDSRSLELREDPEGLRVWARIPKTLSYAQDMRELFSHGIARGMSFAFSMPSDGSGEDWAMGQDGTPVRTLRSVSELFDVSPVTRGAYSKPSFSMRSVYDAAVELGRVPLNEERAEDTIAETAPDGNDLIAPDGPVGEANATAARRLVAMRARAAAALANATQ